MKSNAPAKQFDCVAYMRQARERISTKISGMSRGEFRRWGNSSLTEDPILARLVARHRESAERGTDESSQ